MHRFFPASRRHRNGEWRRPDICHLPTSACQLQYLKKRVNTCRCSSNNNGGGYELACLPTPNPANSLLPDKTCSRSFHQETTSR